MSDSFQMRFDIALNTRVELVKNKGVRAIMQALNKLAQSNNEVVSGGQNR
ncbi:MAG: hypothetical protein P8N11_00705 [Gammaproteobacteria bacterium]|nr:hypothetical protein [Gammaproteobacteria bacterium]